MKPLVGIVLMSGAFAGCTTLMNRHAESELHHQGVSVSRRALCDGTIVAVRGSVEDHLAERICKVAIDAAARCSAEPPLDCGVKHVDRVQDFGLLTQLRAGRIAFITVNEYPRGDLEVMVSFGWKNDASPVLYIRVPQDKELVVHSWGVLMH